MRGRARSVLSDLKAHALSPSTSPTAQMGKQRQISLGTLSPLGSSQGIGVAMTVSSEESSLGNDPEPTTCPTCHN